MGRDPPPPGLGALYGWFVGYLAIALGALCSAAGATVARRAHASSPTLVPIVAQFLPAIE